MKDTPDPDSTHLYLIRHGATDANLQRPYILQGRGINMALSETGRQQAAAAGEFMKRFSLAAVYSSSLVRAHETGTTVAGHHGLECQAIEGLEECHVGDWEGMDWGSIMERDPDAYHAFMADPGTTPYLNGESYGDVLSRVQPVVSRLLEEHRGQSIAIVAHNVVNRVYLANLLGVEIREAKNLKQANACVNVIEKTEETTHVVAMNSYFHLPEDLR